MKKISVLLVVLTIISCFVLPVNAIPIPENARSFVLEDNGGELLYTAQDGKVVIYGYKGSGSELHVPAYIDDNKVCEIAREAFMSCDTLQSVYFPDTLTIIGPCAFYKNTVIQKVSLPDGLEEIRANAFNGCTNLTDINIPKSVTKLGEACIRGIPFWKDRDNWYKDAFLFINDILIDVQPWIDKELVVIKEGTKAIGDYAMSKSETKRVILPGSVKSIGVDAFYDCRNLESVYIPEGVTEISASAFHNCTNLTEVTIPASVESIGRFAFGYKSEGWNTEPYGLTIKGYSGTAAEEYADQNGITFVDLGEAPYPTAPDTFETESETVSESETESVTETVTETETETVIVTETDTSTEPKETDIIPTETVTEPTESFTEPQPTETVPAPTKPTAPSVKKKTQEITVKSYNLVYGAKSFKIKAFAKGKLSFSVRKNSVIRLNSKGEVKVIGCGIVKIIVKAAKTELYKSAKKTITITVRPQKPMFKNGGGTTARYVINFKKLKDVSGYELFYRAKGDKKWKIAYAKKNASSIVLENLKFSQYEIKLRGYKRVGKKKLYGAFVKAGF